MHSVSAISSARVLDGVGDLVQQLAPLVAGAA
jgi:hypothetical protein